MRTPRSLVAVALALVLSVLGVRALHDHRAADPVVAAARTAASAPATSQPAVTEAAADGAPVEAEATAPPAPLRSVVSPGPTAFAAVAGVVLVHPADRVERVAFHQSNHEGAREMIPGPDAVNVTVLESRGRLAAPTSAADIVVDPDGAVRAPVTGTVKRAGSYNLYCKLTDDYVVIAPDAQPDWEVKILHIQQHQVRRGQRVEAGVTPIAVRPTQLPFESQVDEIRTADPAWPHVHIEVVDPSIPNVPNGGSGSSC